MNLKAALCFLSLPALLCSASADQEPQYVRVGGDLQLTPLFSGPIENILWKYEGNLLAEWLKVGDSVITYGKFKDRTTVDKTTGRLEVKKLGRGDSGTYTVEINNNVLDDKHLVKVIQDVPSPSVWIKPVACGPDSPKCTLTCDGDTDGAEPVTYYWRKDGGDWVKSSKNMSITADDTKHVETFSCMMKNPVSGRDSEPKQNPLFVPHTPTDLTGLWVVLCLFSVLAAGGVVAFLKRETIKERIANCQKKRDSTAPAESPPEPSLPLNPSSNSNNTDK